MMKEEAKKQIEELYKIGTDILIAQQKKKGYSEGLQRILTGLYPDNAHFIFELLQNAEDAGASKVSFELGDESLVFTHNGDKLFDYDDVDSITNIGFSTKADDINSIGKFGVGFKAVFAYTRTPRIFSGEYCFEIHDLICPYPLVEFNNNSGETRFEFPFNHATKSQDDAFLEINKGLKDLKDNVLLFLNNIVQISMEIEGLGKSYINRHVHNENIIEIKHQRLGETNYLSSYWLRFIAPISDGNKLYVAVAFGLGFKDEEHNVFDNNVSISEQMEIVPVQGQLSIFFPADKEATKLKFHIHAPYSSTVARDSIPYHNENKVLIEKTAVLLSKSLSSIKEMGLLTTSFLETLPNNKDALDEFYGPLQDKVIETMKCESLVPTYQKGYAPATELLQGPKDIKDVITDIELPFFTGTKNVKWAIGVMQNSRADHFLLNLGIGIWRWKELMEAVKKRFYKYSPDYNIYTTWLSNKSDEWMQQLYALLETAISDYKNETINASYSVANWIIIRDSIGSHVTGSGTYFPSHGTEITIEGLTRVKPEILKGNNKSRLEKAHRFLEKAGVKEAGECEEIQLILNSYYTQGTEDPSVTLHLQHLKRFILYWSDKKDLYIFNGYYILLDEPIEGYYLPKDLYIDLPYLDTGLSALYSDDSDEERKEELWHGYNTIKNKEFISFAVALGVMDKLRVEKTSIDYRKHPDWVYLTSSYSKRSDYAKDEDYSIPKLQNYLSKKSKDISLLIWKTMSGLSSDPLQARCRRNLSDPYKIKPSTLVYCLRKTEWIPAKDGKFYNPVEVSKDMLPPEFSCDDRNGWLTAIGFGDNVKKHEESYKKKEEMAKQLGIPFDLVKLFANQNVSDEDKKQLVAGFHELYKKIMSPVAEEQMPSSQATDAGRRLKKAIEQAEKAEDKISEEKTRIVRVTAYSNDPQAKEYLRNHNKNENGNVICQLCNNKMPFKLNGSDYFESIQYDKSLTIEIPANHLALCPNCAAEFSYVCDTDDNDKRSILLSLDANLNEEELIVPLNMPIHKQLRFTQNHLIDLKAALRTVDATYKSPINIESSYEQTKPELVHDAPNENTNTTKPPQTNQPVPNIPPSNYQGSPKRELKKCPNCNALIRKTKFEKHIKQSCPMRGGVVAHTNDNPEKGCPYCKKRFAIPAFVSHQWVCSNRHPNYNKPLSKYSF